MNNDPELIIHLAVILDYPNIHMGGPTKVAIRKAKNLIRDLEAADYVIRKRSPESAIQLDPGSRGSTGRADREGEVHSISRSEDTE